MTRSLRLILAACLGLLLGAVASVQAQGQLSVQVLQLLSRVNTWTATQSFQDLRVPVAATPSDTSTRIYTDISGNLYYNGALIAGVGGVTNPHNLLSSTHSDTLTASVVRGDVLIGNATPKWARLATGTTGKFLRTDGTDISWGTDASALTAIPAAQLTGTIAAISGVNLTNLNASNLASGTVPLAQLSGITNTQIAAGAAIAYSKLALTTSILNADIAAGAAIAYSKLNLTASVVTGDLVAGTLLFDRWSLNGCTANQIAKVNAGATAWACAADANSGGTVTSAALTVPSFLSVAGSPVTTTGTLAVTLATQTANTVFAGPTSGGVTIPTFRALVNADFPITGVVASSYSKVTVNAQGLVTAGASASLATDVTGTLPVANGGTGLTAATDDRVMVGSGAAWVAATLPSCSTDALSYNNTTNLFACTILAHNLLSATHSDTLAGSVVRGDLMIGNSTPKWTRLAIGTAANPVLVSNGTDPAWASTIAYGTITTSTPFGVTQTWNAAGVSFRGVDLTITDTASAAASTGFRVMGGAAGTTVEFSVDKSGNLTAAGSVTQTFSNYAASTIIASAGTIAPTGTVAHVSGTSTISTITVPSTCTPTCSIVLVPDGLWLTNTAGNISLASTAVVNKALWMTWDGVRWNPSY